MGVEAHLTRRLFVAGLTLLPSMAAAAAPTDAPLRRLIAANTAARGGARRLRRLRSMDAVLRIIEPGLTVIGHYRAERRGRMRIDVFAEGKRAFSEGIDESGGWAWPGGDVQPKPIGDQGLRALEHGIVFNLAPLFEVSSLGHRLSLVSAAPPCIQIAFADGFSARVFLDPLSGHVVRRQDRRAYHPDVDATQKRIESRFADFRDLDGVISPWLAEDFDLDSDQRIGRTETLQLVWDRPVARSLPRAATVVPPDIG